MGRRLQSERCWGNPDRRELRPQRFRGLLGVIDDHGLCHRHEPFRGRIRQWVAEDVKGERRRISYLEGIGLMILNVGGVALPIDRVS